MPDSLIALAGPTRLELATSGVTGSAHGISKAGDARNPLSPPCVLQFLRLSPQVLDPA